MDEVCGIDYDGSNRCCLVLCARHLDAILDPISSGISIDELDYRSDPARIPLRGYQYRRSLPTRELHCCHCTMETTQAAAASLYKFAIRSTIGDNYTPKYTHYLPLFIVDGNGNPKTVIAKLDDSTFVVKN